MKIKLKIEKEYNVSKLLVSAGVRYWEDATINGKEDTEGDLIPCRAGENWCPLIDLESGKILNWNQGAEANIHYKVCDDGKYTLLDDNGEIVKEIEGYVPKIMCPEGGGYGDYIIMKVGESGQISKWKCVLKEFNDED